MPVPTRRDLIAQWAFDTRPLLLRFHLWLEDVEVEWLRGDPERGFGDASFVPGQLRRCLAMTSGLTALGTRLFGRFGEARGRDKQGLNEVKKDADAVSAYVMSESLWHFTRGLPENHAIMVSLGEGIMPKAGESPEMGANPLLGFGRVYARPSVAKFIDARVHRLLNEPGYGWAAFYRRMRERGLTLWGAAVDTLENTSRFAKGEELGPMSVLHLFDQPMAITRPYEAYMGSLTLPRSVVDAAEEQSIRIDLLTPRRRLVEAIELTLPGIRREHIHVWTLGGKSREGRLGALWHEWRELGVHLVEDGWICPSGLPAFTESGTYAPTYLVGTWNDAQSSPHVFLCDGYAASAEAVQAASLAQALDVEVSLALFTPVFELPMGREQRLGRLDPEADDFEARLGGLFGGAALTKDRVELYRRSLREMAEAHLPTGRRALRADDFFPEKTWRVLAAIGYMGPDPYSGVAGVERLHDDTFRVTTQLAAEGVRQRVAFTFRFLESFEQTRLVFSPLLERFMAGESYSNRAVKVSDSGRIRNELQTLCSQALEYTRDDRIRVHLERIDDLVISAPRKRAIREVLEWYAANHPVWFHWLEIA
jgi:hypothetical protein